MQNKRYDLEGRTTQFGIRVVQLCRQIKQDPITIPIIQQLIRSGTSVGANYMEANAASSRRDFQNKIFICKKEAQETKYWLILFLQSNPDKKNEIEYLSQECQQLILIFGKIIFTLRKRM